ncbi:MAG: phosphate ABC transporter permease [Candidatus Yanofskybacteria bacterium RIFCSPLOWO2_02_FULL_45_10]|uniref:Transport permease protein n=3 Tax=Patescibacteria group TaxID=1783273 RepID=A0A1F8G2H6_9BACT|nr:MAG: Polysaccharide ABC transporter, permease protein [Candidatus Daviesbacteria bacterium GW2011_GWB1_41_5]OGN19547.1 MAG: phosphate ABC transporter permease [Candidatus Yanofskybacteria bacterium RIFCSPHIGHO2_12_FULL_45_19b]OGN32262.1 MAG: phosphate ABC transporter permease [Candidatus Yanofskybacteria bacterium RIFCSPLOWO2_02_FULL_45_10]
METTTTIIKPQKKFSFLDLKEIWDHKGLLYFFTWRDLKIRYKQTLVGIGWALFQPFVTMIVFSIFFGNFAKIPSDGIPYPIFVYSGLLFWQFFSASLAQASSSLVSNQNIITRVYFPRLILPFYSTLTNLIDFGVASLMLVVLMFYYGFAPEWLLILLIPVLILITFMFAVGLGLFLASLNVKYRDIKFILPFFIQMLLFVTPVIYPPSILGKYSWLLAFNPMTGVIKTARTILLGGQTINWLQLEISSLAAVIIFVVGVVYFKKTEKYFADLI